MFKELQKQLAEAKYEEPPIESLFAGRLLGSAKLGAYQPFSLLLS